jgi:hypothetical protein
MQEQIHPFEACITGSTYGSALTIWAVSFTPTDRSLG